MVLMVLPFAIIITFVGLTGTESMRLSSETSLSDRLATLYVLNLDASDSADL